MSQPKLPNNAPLRIYTYRHIMALMKLVDTDTQIEVREHGCCSNSWKDVHLPKNLTFKRMVNHLFDTFGDETKFRVKKVEGNALPA